MCNLFVAITTAADEKSQRISLHWIHRKCIARKKNTNITKTKYELHLDRLVKQFVKKNEKHLTEWVWFKTTSA